MDDLYNNKYRIKSARASWWDYGNAAAYFITICAYNHECFFGEIKNGMMCLSEIGTLAYHEYLRTIELRPDMNLKIGEFVVMPNHIHGIIIIGKNRYNKKILPSENRFRPQKKNLSSIIRGYKGTVTKQARKFNPSFKWQAKFHDHIIRNTDSFDRISDYIINNPLNWNDDKYYK